MSIVLLRNGREIGDYLKPYIVAELNTSHFGNIEIARNMIRRAKEVGCDCVKFQSWSAETLYCDSYYQENKIAKRIVKKFSLDNDQLQTLSEFASEIGIDFSSTPYSIEEACFLVETCKVPFIKIASMELDNLPYLKELAKLGVPLVLSTGMGILDEIFSAVSTISATGNNQLIVLHCTSVYPSPPAIIRLNNILALRAELQRYPIGYSDHSIGIEMPVASVALGACLIEKHFTLDSKQIGMDNHMATEPHEMDHMIRACNNVHTAMGGLERSLSEEEKAMIPKIRRSMVSKIPLSAGTVLSSAHVEFKRPGNGITPPSLNKYIGRTLGKDLAAGVLIQPEFFVD